jgi:hypothetical protein
MNFRVGSVNFNRGAGKNLIQGTLLLPFVIFLLWFFISIPWDLMTRVILWVPISIFNFLIDPVPSDGRTKEQALAVVIGGDKAILLLKFELPPSEWSDESIEALSRVSYSSILFQKEIQNRLYCLRQFYSDNPQIKPSEYQSKKLLNEWKISPSFFELIMTNALYRNYLFQFLILLLIIIYAAT